MLEIPWYTSLFNCLFKILTQKNDWEKPSSEVFLKKYGIQQLQMEEWDGNGIVDF